MWQRCFVIEEPFEELKESKKEPTDKILNTHATRQTLHPLESDHILEAKEVRYELVSADSGKVIVDTKMENLKGQINSMMERITD